MTELGPEDRVSQVASCQDTTTTTCGKLLTRQIDPNCKRAIRAHDLARAKAKMPLLLRPLRLTPRSGYKSEKQNSKLKRNTSLFLKVARPAEIQT